MRNDNLNDENPHIIVGTRYVNDSSPKPNGVSYLFEVHKFYSNIKA